jgi:hypothetical protein
VHNGEAKAASLSVSKNLLSNPFSTPAPDHQKRFSAAAHFYAFFFLFSLLHQKAN